MASEHPPVTPATSALEAAAAQYRLVPYGKVSSAEEAAEKRGVPLEALAKTLVVRVSEGEYVLVLVPGHLGLDYKKLRDLLGVRRLTMPDPDEAKAATGYARGAITPFGAGDLRTIVDDWLAALPEVSLGSGVHGWAIHMSGEALTAFPHVEVADVAG